MRIAAAGAKLLDSWLARHDLRPSEFKPGSWRAGFLVRQEDQLSPLIMPARDSLAAAPFYRRRTDPADQFVPFQAKDLIREAEALTVPAAAIPPIVEERRGAFAQFIHGLGR